MFNVADIKREGKISKNEWNTFYKTFIIPFELADSNKDQLLDEKEFKEAIKDIDEQGGNFLTKGHRENYIQEIMETLSKRTKNTRTNQKLSINLNEYIYMRRAGVAWLKCVS